MLEETLDGHIALWRRLTNIELGQNDVGKLKHFLGSRRNDDLVFVEFDLSEGIRSGHTSGITVEERISPLDVDGLGMHLRKPSLDDTVVANINDRMSIYLCRIECGPATTYRFAYFDFRPMAESRYLLCNRENYEDLINCIRRSQTGKGLYFIGFNESDASNIHKVDEKSFFLDSQVLDHIQKNTIDFLRVSGFDLYRKLGIHPKRGILLHGPPGVGKTVVSRIVAKRSLDAGVNVVHFDSTTIRELSFRLSSGLRSAMKRSPVVILIDDIDLFCSTRDEERTGRNALPDLLECLDGIETPEGYAVMATTNRLGVLDPALRRPGRFDVLIKMNLPTLEQIAETIKVVLMQPAALPLQETLASLKGLSYADLAEIGRRYKLRFIANADQDYSWNASLFHELTEDFARERATEEGK